MRDLRIKFLACFDTVGLLGIPDLIPLLPASEILNGKYKFHDTSLSSIIDHAVHACVVDERRKAFSLTPLQLIHTGILSDSSNQACRGEAD